MYLEWMKKYFVFVSVLLFLFVLLIFIFKRDFSFEIFVAPIIGSSLFGIIQFLVCRFIYKDTISIKLNLMLLMWDTFLLISAIGSFQNISALIPIMIVVFFVRTELVLFSKMYRIKGK